MTIKAIIADDEPLAVEGLKAHCERIADVEIIDVAMDGETALRMVESKRPDVLFLDIGMPGLTGLDVAGQLRNLQDRPHVIFATAYGHFATEAFDLSVTDYILKPIETDRLHRAVERVRKSLAAGSVGTAPRRRADELWVLHRGAMLRLPLDAISRVDADGDYVRIHSGGRSYLLRQTMSAIERRLDSSRFLRVHRSTIIPRDCIRGLKHVGSGTWVVIAEDGRTTRIGRSYLTSVRKELCINAHAII